MSHHLETKTCTTWEMILWWELRRLPYNVAVGITGLLSLVLMELIGSSIIQPGEDYVEPLAVIFGILLFGTLANVGYTLGWIVERKIIRGSIEKHRAFRKTYFRRGILLSCALATLPIWEALLALSVHHS